MSLYHSRFSAHSGSGKAGGILCGTSVVASGENPCQAEKTAQVVSKAPPFLKKEARPSTHRVKAGKKKERPTRRDFLEETKLRNVLALLARMGFLGQRSGKGSHIVRFNEQGNVVVVPKDVGKAGLRDALFDEASAAGIS